MIALLRAVLRHVQALLQRRARRYEREGLHGIAAHLRHRAEALDGQRPRAGPTPATEPQVLPLRTKKGGKA
jgi:hypothetical protein